MFLPTAHLSLRAVEWLQRHGQVAGAEDYQQDVGVPWCTTGQKELAVTVTCLPLLVAVGDVRAMVMGYQKVRVVPSSENWRLQRRLPPRVVNERDVRMPTCPECMVKLDELLSVVKKPKPPRKYDGPDMLMVLKPRGR